MTDKLIVRIENGSMYYESHKGNWLYKHHDEIMDYFNDQIDSLRDDKGVANALYDSRRDGTVFFVTILKPFITIEVDEYQSDYVYLDWGKDSITVEPIPEPIPQVSKDQMSFADILETGL